MDLNSSNNITSKHTEQKLGITRKNQVIIRFSLKIIVSQIDRSNREK